MRKANILRRAFLAAMAVAGTASTASGQTPATPPPASQTMLGAAYNLDIARRKTSAGLLLGPAYNLSEKAWSAGALGYAGTELMKIGPGGDVSASAGAFGALNTAGNDRGVYAFFSSKKTGLYAIAQWNKTNATPSYFALGKSFTLRKSHNESVTHGAWLEAGIVP